jgi:hypothetical protein
MFTEILKIIPKMDGKDLAAMEKNLNGRFVKIAKKFGGGLVAALTGGGVTAVALGLIDKLLNPMKEVQEAIEKSLKAGDDLSTFAKQFNTTAGNLARLQAFGKSTGLDPEGVRMLLLKFQSSVANAAKDPSQRTAVSNYVGKKDTAEAFFEFVQALQKLTPTQQNLVQQEVFGEKQILKASEFLQADFKFLTKALGGPSAQELTLAAEKLGTLNDMKDLLSAQSDLKDLKTKASLVGPNTIGDIHRAEEQARNQENKGVGKFGSLAQLSFENQKLLNAAATKFLEAVPYISGLATKIDALLSGGMPALLEISRSRAARGVGKSYGTGKDK